MLLVDNGSAYTSTLAAFLDGTGVRFQRMPPRLLDLESAFAHDSFILSGRRRNDRTTNLVNSKLVRHAVERGKKALGICYGAEIMALALGGTIRRSTRPSTGSNIITVCGANPLCDARADVFESHAFEISALPEEVIPIATSRECRYEMIRHRSAPIFGTQFHPEMSEDGRRMVERFCRL